MRAIALKEPGRRLELIEAPKPALGGPDELLLRVLEVGVCGTDREIARGEVGELPSGCDHMIIGHEMLAEVVEVGSGVSSIAPGELVVSMVRHGCDACTPCLAGSVDFCASGGFVEHGIKQLDGFMAEYVVEKAAFCVPVPSALREIAVLVEPLSVCEKAFEQAIIALGRIPGQVRRWEEAGWAAGLHGLVAGSGPIGMLGAMLLKAHGADVTVIDRSDEEAYSSRLLKEFGIAHINGANVVTEGLDDTLAPVDLIFEATGAAGFAFRLADALTSNGVYVMTGIPGGHADEAIPASALMRQIVLHNQTLLGTVNASKANVARAVADLERFQELWGDAVARIITLRVPLERFMEAIEPKERGIKAVVMVSAAERAEP